MAPTFCTSTEPDAVFAANSWVLINRAPPASSPDSRDLIQRLLRKNVQQHQHGNRTRQNIHGRHGKTQTRRPQRPRRARRQNFSPWSARGFAGRRSSSLTSSVSSVSSLSFVLKLLALRSLRAQRLLLLASACAPQDIHQRVVGLVARVFEEAIVGPRHRQDRAPRRRERRRIIDREFVEQRVAIDAREPFRE